MRKTKVKIIIALAIILMALIALSNNVQANVTEDWTDASNVTFKIVNDKIEVSNLTKKSNHEYYLWVAYEDGEFLPEGNYFNGLTAAQVNSVSLLSTSNDISWWLQSVGNLKVQLVEEDNTQGGIMKVIHNKTDLVRNYEFSTVSNVNFTLDGNKIKISNFTPKDNYKYYVWVASEGGEFIQENEVFSTFTAKQVNSVSLSVVENNIADITPALGTYTENLMIQLIEEYELPTKEGFVDPNAIHHASKVICNKTEIGVKFPQTNNGEGKTDEDWTDTSKLKYEIEKDESYGTFYYYKLNISGLTYKDDHWYGIYLYNKGNELTAKQIMKNKDVIADLTEWNNSLITHNITYDIKNSNSVSGILINKYLELNGDVGFKIIEAYKPYDGFEGYAYKEIYNVQKIERPTYTLGTKLLCYFFDDYTGTFNYTPNSSSESERNINLKIGKITDVNILKSIKNGESDSLQKLLDYAKKSEDTVYEGSVPVGKSEGITNNMKLVNEEYYYVYMTLDTENGTYYNIEDIGLYQALVDESLEIKILSSYLDPDFIWNLPEDDEKTETDDIKDEKEPVKEEDKTTADEELPQTGKNAVMFIVISVVSVIVIVSFRKFRNIKLK